MRLLIIPGEPMKACLASVAAAAILTGCGSVPFRYEGADAATIAGEFAANKSIIVEVNGQRRDPPFLPNALKVRPGLLRVGINLHNITGQLFSTGCFEIEAPPGSYHQFTAMVEQGGFLVSLHEGEGERKKLIGTAKVPFRPLQEVKQYCPTGDKS
jgi:hypothetical protein